MAATYSFHPEALFEYAEGATYYLREASPRVSEAFVTTVEFAIAALVAAPERWRVVEDLKFALRIQPYSIRYLLPMGTEARAHYYLCNHALQPRARVLAPPR